MKHATIVGACASYAAYCLFVGSAGIGTSPDSSFYLSFSPLYPSGYPVFLTALGERGAVTVQPLLYATAVALLSLETLKESSSLLLALGVVAVCIAVPGLAALHSSILTESLFMSCELLMLAAAFRFLRRPDWQAALVPAVCAGVAATVRNAAYAFLPLLVVMVLFRWRRLGRTRWAAVAAVTAPIVGGVVVDRVVAHIVNGNQATSLLGRHMFAKAALIDARRAAAPLDSAHTQIEDQLERGFGQIRQTIATAPPSIRSLLTVYYELCLHGPCARDMREAAFGSLPEASQNAILARVALNRIAQAPLSFTRLTIGHYVSMWTAYRQEHPDTVPVLNDYLSTHRPLPYESLAFSWRDPRSVLQFQVNPRVRFIQPAVSAVAWFSGGLAVFALILALIKRPASPLLAMAALSGLTAHAGVLFSATFAPGLSRFTVSFWPVAMTALLLGLWSLVGGLGKRLRQSGV